ncbi:MAG: hypothetical protein JOZ24_03620 [Candidatus Eremiobacteraeota bacterium]|nr:hypothetical protein [Candidatus Eremiobacteraeota bacterium]
MRLQARSGARATCPCCGYPTIRGRGAYDICALCMWEDDGQDDRERSPRLVRVLVEVCARANGCARDASRWFDPDCVIGGPNGDYALSEARANFVQYATMYRPSDPDFETERAQGAVKRRIAAVYERCVDGESTFAEADAEAYALLDELEPLTG